MAHLVPVTPTGPVASHAVYDITLTLLFVKFLVICSAKCGQHLTSSAEQCPDSGEHSLREKYKDCNRLILSNVTLSEEALYRSRQ